MNTTRLILVGGFLGAGKTTLLSQAAARLAERGMRVGLITNDQAANLVDTRLLESVGGEVQEVAGGCFCCRFDDLIAAADRLIEAGAPEIIIGEPVGSCTDLAATVIRPMGRLHRDRFHIAPFSVLVDVRQVRALEGLRLKASGETKPRFPENVMYIYRKQLEEADVIVLNKADLIPAEELAELEAALRAAFPQAPVIAMSAKTGQGVDAWFEIVLSEAAAGRRVTDVDYDVYADGEAALGWLNASVELENDVGRDYSVFLMELMERLRSRLRADGVQIAHLKVALDAGGELVANLTNNDEPVSLRGSAGGDGRAKMIVNARAETAPATLRAAVEDCLAASAAGGIRMTRCTLESFAPGRPQPIHRE